MALTLLQLRFLSARKQTSTDTEACRIANVRAGAQTVWKWKKQPEFMAEYEHSLARNPELIEEQAGWEAREKFRLWQKVLGGKLDSLLEHENGTVQLQAAKLVAQLNGKLTEKTEHSGALELALTRRPVNAAD